MNTLRSYTSPNYGGRLGYGIFQWVVRLLGIAPAYILLIIIVPYYVLIRGSARKSAGYYLKHRFPGYSPLRRFLMSFQYFYEYGKVLIDQGAMGILGRERFHIEFPGERDLFERAREKKGLVLLTSHVGNWQAAMAAMDYLKLPVHFHFQLEQHTSGRHFFDLSKDRERFHIIPPDTPFGGMIEMTSALTRGECVAIMGDRSWGARTDDMTFLGEPAPFPITPYHLAIATGAEIVVLFTVRTGKLSFRIESLCITEGTDWSKMPKQEATGQLLHRYGKCLESYLQKYPLMWFNFFDFWKRNPQPMDQG